VLQRVCVGDDVVLERDVHRISGMGTDVHADETNRGRRGSVADNALDGLGRWRRRTSRRRTPAPYDHIIGAKKRHSGARSLVIRVAAHRPRWIMMPQCRSPTHHEQSCRQWNCRRDLFLGSFDSALHENLFTISSSALFRFWHMRRVAPTRACERPPQKHGTERHASKARARGADHEVMQRGGNGREYPLKAPPRTGDGSMARTPNSLPGQASPTVGRVLQQGL